MSLKNEAHTAQTKGLACAAERGNHQVGFVTRESIGAFAFDHHLSRSVHRIGAQCEFKFVVVVQSSPTYRSQNQGWRWWPEHVRVLYE